MMSAAIPKVTTGWPDPHSHAVLAHLAENTFVAGRSSWIATKMLQIRSGLFWESMDYATVVLEGSFLFLVVRRTYFRLACAVACFFHLGIALSMGIAYWPNLLIYGACCDWSVAEKNTGCRRLLRFWENILAHTSLVRLLLLSALMSLLYLGYGNPFHKVAELFPPETDPLGLAVCIFAVMVATIFLALVGMRYFELPPPASSVVLFDGYCGLCNGWVDFILRHDHRVVYRFATIQSPSGQQMLERVGAPPGFVDSIVLLEAGQVYYRSTAIIRILRGLGFPFHLASAYLIVPRSIRDVLYNFVASHRLGWFGERDTCRLPSPGERKRFLVSTIAF
jgi:predicted DCC family thiol-disulfide oxidoreductase YuxK